MGHTFEFDKSRIKMDGLFLCHEIVNRAIKMIVFNTKIELIFKLPVALIPLINVSADFYYKDPTNLYKHPNFDQFYSSLFDTGFFGFIQDASDLLFKISLSIQLFIYIRFDTKFNTAFYTVFGKKQKQKE